MFVLVNSGDSETQTGEDIGIEHIVTDIVIRAKPDPLAVSATSEVTEWAAHRLIGAETHGPPAVSTLDKAGENLCGLVLHGAAACCNLLLYPVKNIS